MIEDKAGPRQWLDERRRISSRIKHRGLKRLYETGDRSGIGPDLIEKAQQFLAALDSSTAIDDFRFHGLHPLKFDMRGYWAVNASANWRIVFRFEGTVASDIRLVDYH